MLAFIEGKIIYKRANWIILATKDSIGYKIFVSPSKSYKIQTQNSFYLYHYIKEDRQDLYGFEKVEDLEIFETLISISGVGPKTALLVVTQYSAKEIKQAIEKENLVFFQSVKGLGKKTAQKILLELRGKLIIEQETTINTKDQDILDALMGLGYQKKDLLKTIEQIPKRLETSEEKIKWILKNIGK